MSGQQPPTQEHVTLVTPEGWQPAELCIKVKYRIFTTVQKEPKGGGTRFSLTAPGPTAYFGFDKDVGEDVLPKFVGKKQIVVCDYSNSEIAAVPLYMDKGEKDKIKDRNKELAVPIIEKFEKDIDHWLTQPVRTIVIDTETELYEIKRFATFGSASAHKEEYAQVNKWFKNILTKIESTDKNLILLQQADSVWLDGDRTGTVEGKGFKRTHWQVKSNIILRRLKQPNANGVYLFELEVLDSSQNPLIKGLKLQSDPSREANWQILTGDDKVDRELTKFDQASFPWLGVHVFPETTLKDWV